MSAQPFDPATVEVGDAVWIDEAYNNAPRWVECKVTRIGRVYWTAIYRGNELRFPKSPREDRDLRTRTGLSEPTRRRSSPGSGPPPSGRESRNPSRMRRSPSYAGRSRRTGR